MDYLALADLALKLAILGVALALARKSAKLCLVVALMTLTGCNGAPLCSGELTVGPLGIGLEIVCDQPEPEPGSHLEERAGK